ncbi:hypothetical protein DPMN_103146 [Dreissena polymorpha]|uniref:Uncharacterized protein n=1 Tax=Dreissena polymorpha TaxID=45954 RepID=A0A9D4H7I5_DREPO|nr:hypothetical protein DPMN_103146 [Dreissena polymorpha]
MDSGCCIIYLVPLKAYPGYVTVDRWAPNAQGENIVRPVRGLNPGHLAVRESALSTELTGPPHNLSPYVTKFRP